MLAEVNHSLRNNNRWHFVDLLMVMTHHMSIVRVYKIFFLTFNNLLQNSFFGNIFYYQSI